ncbi:DEAD/DEAH box helicase [Vibrio cincinnatiensis]|uniref:Superfamily II DNA and RNA helicase n=1 Tax=Vibrio cincinnatiensis DSM 19608 TaxID=1123491 RepID=A0A1T4Q571_VIBCI|nr:DEAD/DEAH box helicase [Vibrio cincinnatiensis]MCG3721092.1 DEAD/DEAH box helicase [Vibrio cincinnatiensis]MCG3726846.1 DEAD/DEAH box helicase [Vibrio cincinnatiensis]MCG3737011.1 DEAD/DEAH box helicase [Vibrio cincinnatiensis]MCG3745471.1 DEAD/DEAH box helicase [Vibrio cincinnatiensis]SJZ98935.1 Superfamily II DNA and RNA helicase [Vibrio cincinnatiensis DSM 19608]
MQFKELGLDNRLLKTLAHYNFKQATDIQRQAIPVAMAGKDLLASSKTGSGKTLAFLLPMLHKALKNKALSSKDPRGIILVPTRELAKQVYSELRSALAGLSYTATLITGGENFNDQVKALRRGPRFIVATPGRLADHLEHRSLFLDGLETLILDEADRMLDLGFAPQLRHIHKAAKHRRRQTLMFSATLDHAEMNDIAYEMLNDPKRIAIGLSNEQHKDIQQRFYLCDHLDHKEALLERILQEADYRQVIIFTATRVDTERLTEKLNQQHLKAVALSGNLNQAQRNTIMSQFERAIFKILVTTDVASRGLDIASVTHVINFDMPKHTEEYVHRVGRTGRAGNKGDAISLVGPKDWDSFKRVEAFLQQEIQFDVLEGLQGKFKGLKVRQVVHNTAVTANKAKPQQKKTAKKPVKRDKSYYQNVAVGDSIFIPKKKTPPKVDDGE